MLMGFARVGTDKGIIHAAQCVARLGIQNDPRITFPGQRSLEVPKILKCLMHVECTALMNYEALMCLTNLASLDDEHRRRIYKEKVFSKKIYGLSILVFSICTILKTTCLKNIGNFVKQQLNSCATCQFTQKPSSGLKMKNMIV